MELTLNLVWVCVAIAGIALLWTSLLRKARSSDGSASTQQKIVAMCCALVILFFVISMTDDLHNQAVLFEEKKPIRVLVEAGNAAPSSATQAIPFISLLSKGSASLLAVLPDARRPVEPPESLKVSPAFCETVSGRAPPFSSLA